YRSICGIIPKESRRPTWKVAFRPWSGCLCVRIPQQEPSGHRAEPVMKCPFCREGDFAVIDSRSHEGCFPIRRRRRCPKCHRRVWTAEQIEEVPLKVIKKDESREAFDAAKLRRGIESACYKRPVSSEQVESIVRQVENEVYANYFGEVPVKVIGELSME